MRLPWRRRTPAFERPEPPRSVTLEAVGFVRNAVAKPRPRGWENVESVIEMLPEHEARMRGIDGYSHLLVVFYMDVAEGAPEKPETLKLASGNTYGIFATRSQLRPNHLGVSAVELLAVEGTRLRVRGLDAIDGTPVLDIKPYLPEYDAVPGARVPGGGT
ncbi:MAG: tRNA (N6-threonylcarbamoyladenosine(37)-N6)-methyltransferase TrmO [Chloroflexi bacterium]|nr:tRNA (N6-threonylcarbamoyladenosine(37)-N6)-methyltransferase TrmO [Chloroflexota bacterium]